MYRSVLLGKTTELVSSYISSIEADREIAREVVLTLISHVLELHRLRILDKDKFCRIYSVLRKLYDNVDEIYREDVKQYEDIHEAIESKLVRELGQDVAGWIGLGRSRNDHVVTAHRLRLRQRLLVLLTKLLVLRRVLLDKAQKYASSLFIVNTHGQPAQVTTFGHYLLSVDEVLSHHVKLLLRVLEDIVNKSPLGAGPAAGVLTPLDRARLARDLGFNEPDVNTLYAVETRSYFTLACAVIVNLLVELTRFANDLMLYSHPSLGYVRLPDEHCATSSIMPHKRNPVTLEILRARAGQAIGYLSGMYTILHGVGKSYYLDLQEVTPLAWNILDIAESSIDILIDLISKLELVEERVKQDLARFAVTSAETAEHIAISTGKSFREVYFYIAEHFRRDEKLELLPPELVVQQRRILGAGNPDQVLKYIDNAEAELRELEQRISDIQRRVSEAVSTLLSTCDEICRG